MSSVVVVVVAAVVAHIWKSRDKLRRELKPAPIKPGRVLQGKKNGSNGGWHTTIQSDDIHVKYQRHRSNMWGRKCSFESQKTLNAKQFAEYKLHK